jgi:threonine dehydrogenase-like Zn-dependent dehydrogenase
MRALCWHGKHQVSIDTVPDPTIQEPTDAIIKVTSTAICGSDLHLFDGYQPTMEEGDILGHEPMGVVVETGATVTKLKKGDRVVVPFVIACGTCFFCSKTLFSSCDSTNPNAVAAAKLMGHSPAGLFGFSHLFGGYAGGQAEYLRVPHADVGPIKIDSDLPDEKVLFLSDILPTGWMAAENADIDPGRYRRCLGMRTCGADVHPELLDARRGACYCHRPCGRTIGHGAHSGARRDY